MTEITTGKRQLHFCLEVVILLQSIAMVAKKLWWQNSSLSKTENNYLLGVIIIVKFWIAKHCLVKHFAFLRNIGHQYLNFVLQVASSFFFKSCWLAHNELSWNVLLFSCNLIGQLCLRSPGHKPQLTLSLRYCMLNVVHWFKWDTVEPWYNEPLYNKVLKLSPNWD